LEDISIYTYEDDIPLVDVYKLFYEKTGGKKAIDHKSNSNELRESLKEILPNFDEERVYNSDVKKLFQWFNLLIEANLLTLEEEKKEGKEESNDDLAENKPAKTEKKKSE